MAVLFINDNDTTGAYFSPAEVEGLTADITREQTHTIRKAKATDLETLWTLDRLGVAQWPGGPIKIVTNRYEESHRIMQEAHARQEKQQ